MTSLFDRDGFVRDFMTSVAGAGLEDRAIWKITRWRRARHLRANDAAARAVGNALDRFEREPRVMREWEPFEV